MVKKYHQNKKDREDESRAMRDHRMSSKGPMDSQYYGMLHEDHDAPANLPQHVIQKKYPRCGYMDEFELDDTIKGLDETRKEDIEIIERYPSDSKY